MGTKTLSPPPWSPQQRLATSAVPHCHSCGCVAVGSRLRSLQTSQVVGRAMKGYVTSATALVEAPGRSAPMQLMASPPNRAKLEEAIWADGQFGGPNPRTPYMGRAPRQTTITAPTIKSASSGSSTSRRGSRARQVRRQEALCDRFEGTVARLNRSWTLARCYSSSARDFPGVKRLRG